MKIVLHLAFIPSFYDENVQKFFLQRYKRRNVFFTFYMVNGQQLSRQCRVRADDW